MLGSLRMPRPALPFLWVRNKLNITTLCMDAQELLHATLSGTFGWEAEASTHSTSRPPQLHIVFNLPELALQILCDELRKAIDQRQVQLTDPTVDGCKSFESGCVCSVYCYTFGPSQSAVSEHLKLLTDLPEMQRAAKIRQVRLVSPSKAMFCVEFDLMLKQGTGKKMRKIAASCSFHWSWNKNKVIESKVSKRHRCHHFTNTSVACCELQEVSKLLKESGLVLSPGCAASTCYVLTPSHMVVCWQCK